MGHCFPPLSELSNPTRLISATQEAIYRPCGKPYGIMEEETEGGGKGGYGSVVETLFVISLLLGL